MSYFGSDQRPRPPVIRSLASADAAFNNWVTQNGYHLLLDKAGDRWDLGLHLEQLPHPDYTIKPLCRLHISLSSHIDQDKLIKSGVLNPVTDRRLLSLMGADQIPIKVQVKVLEARSIDAIRSEFASYIVNLRSELKQLELGPLKKRLIGSWVNKKSRFGYVYQAETLDKISLDV